MSEFFPGGAFAYQKITPSEDAAVRRAALDDGVLNGCALSYSGATLTMGAGLLFMCGRVVRHPLSQHWPVANAISGYARLVLTIDLTRAATESEFDQVVDSIEYAAAVDGFEPLIQEEINAAGTRYQMSVCVVSLGPSGITGIVQSAPLLGGPQKTETLEITSLAALDNLMTHGHCRLNIRTGDATVCGVNFSRAMVFVEGYDAATARQTLSLVGSTTRAIRSCEGGVWRPWCVENPPMELGVEYRTTELWEDLPVYVKRIAYSADSFAAQDVTLPHGITGLDVGISADVVWKRDDRTPDGWRYMPAVFYGGSEYNGQVDYVTDEGLRFRLGEHLQWAMYSSSGPVYVTLKYTKR